MMVYRWGEDRRRLVPLPACPRCIGGSRIRSEAGLYCVSCGHTSQSVLSGGPRDKGRDDEAKVA